MKRLFKIFILMVTLFTPITAHAETTSITSTFGISLPATIDLQKVGDSYAYETEVGVKGELPKNSFINIEINDNVKLYDVTNKIEENALEDQSTYVHKEPVDVQMGLNKDTWESVDLNFDEYNYAQLSATACDISAGSWEGACTFTITYVEQVAVSLEEEEEEEVLEKIEEITEPIIIEEEEPAIEGDVSESESVVVEEEQEILEKTEETQEQEPIIEEEVLEPDLVVVEDTEIIAIEEVQEPEPIITDGEDEEELEVVVELEEELEITVIEEELELEPEEEVEPEPIIEEIIADTIYCT